MFRLLQTKNGGRKAGKKEVFFKERSAWTSKRISQSHPLKRFDSLVQALRTISHPISRPVTTSISTGSKRPWQRQRLAQKSEAVRYRVIRCSRPRDHSYPLIYIISFLLPSRLKLCFYLFNQGLLPFSQLQHIRRFPPVRARFSLIVTESKITKIHSFTCTLLTKLGMPRGTHSKIRHTISVSILI